ncbi:CorA metal ion transporter [Malassezia cuniculi]|uniref:CorA metal ion transporter n=1 Tax=Malassezia cuniculi TaxID=948313 RepID=A0AAF0J578_9BASI|nr:CorA metal ion transporter [Malassezia cuniculi]
MSSSPQDRYDGAPSGHARQASAETNMQDSWVVDPTKNTQREQDIDAAWQMSRARAESDLHVTINSPPNWTENTLSASPTSTQTPAVPISGALAAVQRQFYNNNNLGSTTSLDSQSNFIDHRNQSHSLSVNPRSPLAMRAQAERTQSEVPSYMDVPNVEPDRSKSLPTPIPEAPLNRELEDDVCFPMSAHIEEPPIAQGTPYGALRESLDNPAAFRSNKPYPFDFGALESFAEEERDRIGTRGTWPALSTSLSASARDNGVSMGHSAETSKATLYSRRPRRMSNMDVSGNKFQRKIAMFEGGGSYTSSFEPGTAERYTDNPQPPNDASMRPLLNGSVPRYGANRDSKSGPSPAALAQDKPYRFTFYSNALPNTIHARYLSELPAPGQSFEELILGQKSRRPSQAPAGRLAPGGKLVTPEGTDAEEEQNTWWLDVLCPTDQEMKTLSRAFGIHPLTTEDILMEETREKIELFRNYYLVCFRSFDQNPYSPTYLEPLNMYIIVFRDGTLSFHFRHTPHPQNVRRRIKQLKDYINVTSDWISYALIDDITDAFGPLIQSIEFEVDSIDELVLILKDAEQSDMLRRIGTCRKKVMGLLRLMGNKADVVKGLAKRCNEYWSIAPKSDIGLYLSDIQDHLITMTQNLNHYEMILSRSHSNYLAQISIEMTDANNQINDVLSKLTALGTVIVPLNVITGLWGMNVKVPGQDVENLHWFGGIVSVMVVIAVVGYIATVRYLERR